MPKVAYLLNNRTNIHTQGLRELMNNHYFSPHRGEGGPATVPKLL